VNRRMLIKKCLEKFYVLQCLLMIKSFRHKGLRLLFEDDDGSKLPQEMLARIRLILSTLHASEEI